MPEPEQKLRRSMRYPGYDYRLAGGYFITIVLAGREPRFGVVDCGEMVLNRAGRMVVETWQSLPERFPTTLLDEFIVMPDHMHAILFLTNHHADDGVPLSEIVRVFKSMTTTQYIKGVRDQGWPRFDSHLWQSNYYDHIIRNDADLETRRRYIAGNPARWDAKRLGRA